jgi:hypothetical protein
LLPDGEKPEIDQRPTSKGKELCLYNAEEIRRKCVDGVWNPHAMPNMSASEVSGSAHRNGKSIFLSGWLSSASSWKTQVADGMRKTHAIREEVICSIHCVEFLL